MASEKNKKQSSPQDSKKARTPQKNAPAKNGKTPQKQEQNSGMRFEITAICLIALSIYLMICIYSVDGGGPLGSFIRSLLHGVFGTCAYIIPVVTVALLVYSMFKKTEGSAAPKYVMSYCATLVLGAVFQLIFMPDVPLKECYGASSAGQMGGGLIGGMIVAVLSIFGTAGAYIILFCALAVLIMLIFKVSLMGVIRSVVRFFAGIKTETQPAPKKSAPEKVKKDVPAEGIAVPIDVETDDFPTDDYENEIIFNLPEKDESEEPPLPEPPYAIEDPEIRVYDDDVTSGPEDEEPSEEEKQAIKLSDDEKETIDREIKEEMEGIDTAKTLIEYTYPSVELLSKPQPNSAAANIQEELRNNARQLIETLRSFKVEAQVVEISQGPTITRYEIEPAEGVRVSQITGLSQDIGLRFKAEKGVMVAPVPGKSTIGIEIQNKTPSLVSLREVIESEEFKNHKSKLAVALGKDVSGKPIIMDLAKMPHLLVAGATGAGKSVCINTIIISLLYKADPNEVKLVMVDPKQVELGVYNGIPHLLIPVVKDAKKATGALSWAVQEMTERYSIFERNNVRNIQGYNDLMERNGTPENKMASIVIIIDEFADLMMVAPADVENYVCRIAQLARAAGMHLVIATQRPVVKFITGNIKANVPSRISFAVASVRDSQTILDIGGAEKLIGKGDMLYMPIGETTPMRMQGAFVSDYDVNEIVKSITSGVEVSYDANVIEQIEKDEGEYREESDDPGDADELLPDAIDMAITSGQISTSLLQRRFRIGYNRAGSIIDQMEARGIISGLDGNKPRQVLMTREQYNEMLMKG